MELNNFYSTSDSKFQFTRQQASKFAKNIAGDFNPIHDQDHKRFCVPGDLLFSLVLHHYGISEKMSVEFGGMVADQVALRFVESDSQQIQLRDDKEKIYLTVQRTGNTSKCTELINNLTQAYVGFSGQTFPHILVPLMKQHNMMINPDRPLVIYNSMLIDISDLDITNPTLELVNSTMDIDGKRGNVCLKFNFIENGNIVGTGEKNMVLSSLRDFEEDKITHLVESYDLRKNTVTE